MTAMLHVLKRAPRKAASRRFAGVCLCAAVMVAATASIGAPAEVRTSARKSRAPTLADQRYGPHLRNVLDFYKAKSEKPTPVLIYFHGGGFVGGDKAKAANHPLAHRCLGVGISVVGANYRFVRPWRDQPGSPFPAPMLDGARVIQFVRSKARAWNLDPDRIALAGGSAGACMSIWLAVHDDLADPGSDDPVARLSTRVSCVIGYGGQTVLDPQEILKHIGGNPSIHPSLKPFYGIKSLDELKTPKIQAMIREASSVNHVTKDDPPLQLRYGTPLAGTPLPPDTSIGTSIHHAMFGKLIQEKYDRLGLTCQLVYRGSAAPASEIEFLKEHFGREN